MENTRISQRTEVGGVPLTDAEQEQAGYALREMVRSESGPEVLKVPHEQLEMVRPFFELGWAMGVRTGHTGPAVADMPVDRETIARAFAPLASGQAADSLLRSLNLQRLGPVLWQMVEYHGSVTERHGAYWVTGVHACAGSLAVRYDLSEWRDEFFVVKVSNVRRRSLTPLDEYWNVPLWW